VSRARTGRSLRAPGARGRTVRFLGAVLEARGDLRYFRRRSSATRLRPAGRGVVLHRAVRRRARTTRGGQRKTRPGGRARGNRSASLTEARQQTIKLVEIAETDRNLARTLAIGPDFHRRTKTVGELFLQTQQITIRRRPGLFLARSEHALDQFRTLAHRQ